MLLRKKRRRRTNVFFKFFFMDFCLKQQRNPFGGEHILVRGEHTKSFMSYLIILLEGAS